ncbi:MAG: hypothetical protein RBT34_10890 [Anaerolineaceae bacterium]|jgi:hypothetical protein|nr:hypothetical protein [Anaerolineaceae bacterium]
MLQTDYKELTTTLTTSLVKEFRLLQELVDTLRDERQAHSNRSANEIKRVMALKKMVLNDLTQNADERVEQKETLARLLGMPGEVSCRDLTRVVGADEAAKIQNILEGSIALWKVADETNKASQQYLSGIVNMNGVDGFENEVLLRDSLALTEQMQRVMERISGSYS